MLEALGPDGRAPAASRSAGAERSIASAASRCISMTRSIGSRLTAKPSNAPTCAACSALVRYAWPCMIAVIAAGQRPPFVPSRTGGPQAISRLPRLA